MKKLITVIAVALCFVGTIFVSINTSTDSQQESVFLATSTVPKLGVGYTKFFPCMQQTSEPQWKYSQKFNTFRCGYPQIYDYVGFFGSGGYITSPTFETEPHRGIIVYLKLALIDSWDKETFQIIADGLLVHSHTRTYSPTSSKSCGYAGWYDEYIYVAFGFNHTKSTVTFNFTSTLDQPARDESWGICDLIVRTSPHLVTSTGDSISTIPIGDNPTTFFSCVSYQDYPGWTYWPAPWLVYCPDNTLYLGPFSQGGYLEPDIFEFGTHRGLVVSFRLGLFGSWRGKSFQIKADDKIVYSLTRVNDQGSSFTCGNEGAFWSGENKTITFGFNHTASFMRLKITSDIDHTDDVGWSICNLTFTPSQWPVTAAGKNITVPLTSKLTYFSCKNPATSAFWIYSQGYSTITCNKNTFLGPYGRGGTVTSPVFALGRHSKLIVSLYAAYIDSWDSEHFLVRADNQVIYNETKNGAHSPSNTCHRGWSDEYRKIDITVQHTAPSVFFTISSDLDSSPNDESWGICDFTVQVA